jgi:amino acid transporter
MIIPYNLKDLIDAIDPKSIQNASASPFVVAIKHAGIKVLPGILNGCILMFVFSASNSDLYIASRTIYGIALQDNAPKILAKTDSR